MAEFINYNSFLIVAIFLEALAIWFFLRRGIIRENIFRLLVVTSLITAVFMSLRPVEASGVEAADVLSKIEEGTPTLLEFKSPN